MKKKSCLYSNITTDRISYLQELIRNLIFSFLEMKDVIRTSVLSKQWRTVCYSLSDLTFYQHFFKTTTKNQKDFKEFVYETLILHDSLDVDSFVSPRFL
ncbi:hypothetical protein ACHQM5_009907 [Ranunculus cassubicifolius]